MGEESSPEISQAVLLEEAQPLTQIADSSQGAEIQDILESDNEAPLVFKSEAEPYIQASDNLVDDEVSEIDKSDALKEFTTESSTLDFREDHYDEGDVSIVVDRSDDVPTSTISTTMDDESSYAEI